MRVNVEIDFDSYVKRVSDAMHREPWIYMFLAFTFAAHMIQIAFPSDGSMVFDEAHYVPASLATLQHIAANAEHPPLPKIIGAVGMALFGNNWFGWRIPEVIMSTIALYALYLVARRFLGNPWALGATMILGLDTVFFIHGGALLLDAAPLMLTLLAFEWYFRKKYTLSAVTMGLAFVAREMSLFYFLTLAAYHLYKNRSRLLTIRGKFSIKPDLKIGLKYTVVSLLVLMIVLGAYDFSYQPARATSVTNMVNANVVMNNGTAVTTIYSTSQSISKDLMWNPIQHLQFIYQYHGPQGMVITPHIYQPFDYAWNWILPIDPIPYRVNNTMVTPAFSGEYVENSHIQFFGSEPFNVPTYFRVDVDVSTNGVSTHYTPIWYRAQGNLSLWYGFIPALAVALIVLVKRTKKVTESLIEEQFPTVELKNAAVKALTSRKVVAFTEPKAALEALAPVKAAAQRKLVAFFVAFGMIVNFIPWLYLSIVVSRIGFNYYFIYTLPFIALGLGFMWKVIGKYGKFGLALNVLASLAFFVYFFPVHPMP